MNAFYCRRAGDLLGESARVAPQQKRRAYAMADAKPHFAPDRPCDIVHIWLQDQPHSTYLMTLVVGEFSERTEMVDGLPVQWYVTPGREDDGQRAFGDTPEMVRFFSQKLGVPYPWNKYAQIA
jgi:hypothetical protein